LTLSIVIIHYNVPTQLTACLQSLEIACDQIPHEIIVTDNASTQGPINELITRFPKVRFIQNTTNTGFAVANNQTVTHCQGQYLLLLNPDTIVLPDTIKRCLAFLNQHPETGALGVQMTDEHNQYRPESKRGFPGIRHSLCRFAGLHHLFPRSAWLAGYYAPHVSESDTGSVDVLTGAFLMMPASVYRQVNGFDTDFFLYGEDIDLCCRIRQAGYPLYYLGDTHIIHLKGQSSPQKTNNYIRHFYGAMDIFVRKYYSNRPIARTILHSGIALARTWARIKSALPL
jgi:GT2 family glycosyltransferase